MAISTQHQSLFLSGIFFLLYTFDDSGGELEHFDPPVAWSKNMFWIIQKSNAPLKYISVGTVFIDTSVLIYFWSGIIYFDPSLLSFNSRAFPLSMACKSWQVLLYVWNTGILCHFQMYRPNKSQTPIDLGFNQMYQNRSKWKLIQNAGALGAQVRTHSSKDASDWRDLLVPSTWQSWCTRHNCSLLADKHDLLYRLMTCWHQDSLNSPCQHLWCF